MSSACIIPDPPLTSRFIQYPIDKTKMEETRAWAAEHDLAGKIRAIDGVKDLELSFCPGEGWLAARYIFTDLEDMKTFLGEDNATMAELKVVLAGYVVRTG